MKTTWLMFTLVDFHEIPDSSRATHIWSVRSKRSNIELGQVRWFGRWRTYAFFPAPDTVFNTLCLRGIEAFIRAAMNERRSSGWTST